MKHLHHLLSVGFGLVSCGGGKTPGDSGVAASCEATAVSALETCLGSQADALRSCVESGGVVCGADDPSVAESLSLLGDEIETACATGGLFGLSTQATAERLQAACASESASLAWRTYGGPQAAVWESAGAADRECLIAAHAAGSAQLQGTLAAPADRASAESGARAAIEASCPDPAGLIALDAEKLVERASLQADCLNAVSRPDAGSLDLSCGPTHAAFDAPRGEWTQVEVDPDEWGAVCGDGSPYSFWIRPAPEGSPLDQVVIGLQGGGVCVFEADCVPRLESNPGLFTAADDVPYSAGIVSDDPAVSPFADWTKVYLPYCNQDVFAGGGAVEQLGELALPRAGGVNLRSAVQMTRDWLWRELDAEGGDGFRPDQVTALVGGWSAGAYGTLYNYHWFLDDLQWPRTVAFPDAGLALDNGEALSVAGLGLVKIPLWGTQPNLPPYCFDGQCAVGPTLLEALSPRLGQVPEQQVLLLSNPLDDTQMNDAYFSDRAFWINTLRSDYCGTRELPGVHWYLTSVSDESVHVVSIRDELWLGEVDGQSMRDWFTEALSSPETLQSRVEEADFIEAVPGVEPFPCEVAP